MASGTAATRGGVAVLTTLATMLGTAVLLAPAASAQATASKADGLDRYRDQKLTWSTDCGGIGSRNLTCTKMTVPRDWRNPSAGPDLAIAVTKLASDKPAARRGIMLLNPGGPGGRGTGMPFGIGRGLPKVAEAYDLIGFDPRGVGQSTPITCQNEEEWKAFRGVDFRDRSAAHVRSVLDTARKISTNCQTRSGDLLRYINTDQTVRDMDLIRHLLGEKKISYLGYSAGTWLGAYYATTFPKQVDRFILDSNVDFTGDWYTNMNAQPRAFEQRFSDFLAWMAKYDSVYHYGATAAATRARWEARRATLVKDPLEVSASFTLTAGHFDSGVIEKLYSAQHFPTLASLLAAVESFDSATAEQKEEIANAFGGHYDGTLPAVYYAVTCNDTPWPRDEKNYVRLSAELGKRYPLAGYSWLANPCASWPYRQPKAPIIDGKGLPTVLMINSERDPATPIEGARRAHRNFANSRLVTVQNDGDHGQYGSGNTCVDQIGTTFLLTGVAPTADTTCDGAPLPTPGSGEKPPQKPGDDKAIPTVATP